MSFRPLFFVGLLLSGFFATAQSLSLQVTQCKESYKQDGFVYYAVKFKVLKGSIGLDKVYLAWQDGNEVKAYATLSSGEELKTGQTTKYEEYIEVAGPPLKPGTTLVSTDLLKLPSVPGKQYSFQTDQAFIGLTDYDFFSGIQNWKGVLKIGDPVEYVNFKGEKSKATISKISIRGMDIPLLNENIPYSVPVMLEVRSETKIDFSKAKVATPGVLKSVPVAANTESKSAKKLNHKVKKIPVNVTLANKEIKITIHNLVKFNPDPTDTLYDIFKVDYSLDYYIVDATVENISAKPLDAGEYMIRLNFFDKEGKSADEFTRIFKGGDSEVKRDASAVDINVFGGTGKIKMSQVLVKYQDLVPDYATKHKPADQAMYQPLAPGAKVRAELATILGVPPTYPITGIGTWGGTFYQKKNLMLSALQL